jgi:hypothetical protein
MPAYMRKLPGKRKYRVYDGNKVVAKATSKKNAESQIRLLRGIKHGLKPRR